MMKTFRLRENGSKQRRCGLRHAKRQQRNRACGSIENQHLVIGRIKKSDLDELLTLACDKVM